MRAAIHTPVAARASLAPHLAPPRPRRAALDPLPKTARTLPSSVIAPPRLVAAPIVVAHAAPANASTAKIIVTGRHVELTAPLKEYAVSVVGEVEGLVEREQRGRAERERERSIKMNALSALSRISSSSLHRPLFSYPFRTPPRRHALLPHLVRSR